MFAARFAFQSPQAAAPSGNARRTGSASTNASQSYTAAGTTTTSTAQFKFGTASQYSATNSSYLNTTGGTAAYMNYGTGDFTIEWWQYLTSLSGHTASSDLLANDTGGGFGLRLAQAYNSNSGGNITNKINIFARQQADLDYWTLPTNWPINQWNFCVMQRKSGVTAFWLNGVLCTKTANGAGARSFTSGSNIKIANADGSSAGAGPIYLDEMCFSNTYRYDDLTSSIPVPTAPFTVDTYTTQLLHMDGTNGGTTFVNATS